MIGEYEVTGRRRGRRRDPRDHGRPPATTERKGNMMGVIEWSRTDGRSNQSFTGSRSCTVDWSVRGKERADAERVRV
jgi:hypothetical protein